MKPAAGSAGGARPSDGHDSQQPRDAVIDLARFFCLALIVVGHCMMVSPVLNRDGTVTTENTLAQQPWFVPVIWIVMIMPLFFVAGGITGLQSWRRLRDRGGNGFEFAQIRLLRLVRPAAALLACMFIGLWVARLTGVDPQVIQLMTAGAGMPLWFLATYLAAQLNLPLLARMHERAPRLTLAVLVSAVIAVDSLRGALPFLAFANLVFLWCAVQQLGFFMADGALTGRNRSWLLAVIAGSNLLLGLVTGLGLYSGNMLVNLNPPNFCLFLLGVSQAATFQLLRQGMEWLMSVRWIRWLVNVAGRRSMTIYLWHLPLLVGMTGLLLLTNFPKPASGTAEWWWARPLVLAAVIVLLLPVLLAFGRLEERPTAAVHARGRPPAAVVTAGVVVFVPLADGAFNGLTLALLGGGAACFALAVLLLGRVPLKAPLVAGGPGAGPSAGPGPLPEQGFSATLEP